MHLTGDRKDIRPRNSFVPAMPEFFVLVVSEIFNVEKYRDLEIPVSGQSRSLKVVPLIECVWFPISVQ